VNLGQRVVETLLFYHPAVWWLSARVRREREVCCDDLAAAATRPETCAFALEHVARHTLGLPAALADEFALAFGRRTDLLYRIRHLLGAPAAGPRAGWPAGAMALIVLVAGVVLSRSSSSAQAPQSQPPTGDVRDDRHAPPALPGGVKVDGAGQDAEGREAGTDALPSPADVAKQDAREQAEREVHRAELSVEEAQVTLDAKEKDQDRLTRAGRSTVSAEDLDRAKLDVSLARIRLKRSMLDLEDAKVKFQALYPSSVSVEVAEHGGPFGPGLYNNISRAFSVRGREVTLRQVLSQMRKALDEHYEIKGVGTVTVIRKENDPTHQVVAIATVKDVQDGKAGDTTLRAGDSVHVIYESKTAAQVQVFIRLAVAKRGAGSYQELPRRDMTVTQVVAEWGVDPKTIADAKVTLERKEKDEYHKVLDGVPMGDLLDGKAKDEVVQSNDRIEVHK
jgi:hypothetical protein